MLIELLNKFLNDFENKNNLQIQKYEKGVEKIKFTEIEIEKLRKNLEM